MAGDLTERLETLATRIETSTRHEVDRASAELKDDIASVHHRVNELRDAVRIQNGRVGKNEIAIGRLQLAMIIIGSVGTALLAVVTKLLADILARLIP